MAPMWVCGKCCHSLFIKAKATFYSKNGCYRMSRCNQNSWAMQDSNPQALLFQQDGECVIGLWHDLQWSVVLTFLALWQVLTFLAFLPSDIQEVSKFSPIPCSHTGTPQVNPFWAKFIKGGSTITLSSKEQVQRLPALPINRCNGCPP